MTGARRTPVDRRRVRGAHQGLKKMLLEGMTNGDDRPHAWKDFSGAMVRHGVDEAMRRLPAQDRQVIQLAYFGGYSNREIAAEIGVTEATVQRRLRRALAAISEQIQHGRALGRKAVFGLLLFLSGRWLSDLTTHIAPAAAAAAVVTVIVVVQPATPAGPGAGHATHSSEAVQAPAIAPPLPSPAIPALKPGLPAVPAVPALPTKLPIAVPSLPVQVPPLRP
jgi:hypothetical protein